MSDAPHPAEYWDRQYRESNTPWQLARVPGQLSRWLATGRAGSVLVPGCGSGPEAAAFAAAGWRVTAIDFAPAAVARARAQPGMEAVRLVQGDFFTHPFAAGEFEVIYERTFLTALPPVRWPEYRARFMELLPPGGRVVGYYFYGEDADPPPFGQPPDAPPLLEGTFQLAEDAPSEDALPLFGTGERWQVWTRQG